jgi:sigma-B regulation protein RsbU (phosphoserine phosphatase)
VGGDYFDIVLGMDGLISFLVADVSGHGLGPGLIMAMTRSALRAELRNSGSLAKSLYYTNRVMWDDLSATEAFITLFAARYDPQSQRLHYVNAGHHPALLRRRDGTIEELTAFGMPFGILPTSSYEEQSRDLSPGDTVLVFSDGVVEAAAPDGSLFGTERLRALTAQTAETTAEAMVAEVMQTLATFQADGAQEDDVTVVALRLDDLEEGDECR